MILLDHSVDCLIAGQAQRRRAPLFIETAALSADEQDLRWYFAIDAEPSLFPSAWEVMVRRKLLKRSERKKRVRFSCDDLARDRRGAGPEAAMSRLAAVLSVSDLAKMANVSRQRLHRVLAAAKVPTLRVGIKHLIYLIYLIYLKRCAPDLWLSITEYRNLKS